MKTVTLTRTVDAPRSMVFDAWIKPEHLTHWWGPHAFINPVCELDARPGGAIRIHMCDPEGTVYPMIGEFKEVVAPKLLVFTSTPLGHDDKPLFEVLTTVTFEAIGSKTKLTVKAEVTKTTGDAAPYLQGMEAGWTQSLERLGQSLVDGTPDLPRLVFMTRVFDAPRPLLFKAWTDAKQLQRWHAPDGCKFSFKQMDIREGGEFHTCIVTPDGKECWCRGVYHEVVAPERLVYSMAVADADGILLEPEEVGMDPEWPRETVVTVTFTELPGGKTRLSLHQTVFEAIAKRTGAQPSWLQMLDHLEEQVSKSH